MKMKKLVIASFLLLSISIHSYASELGLKMGSGVLQDNENTSIYMVAYRDRIENTPLFQNVEFGFFSDVKPGSRNSFVGQYSLGLIGYLGNFYSDCSVGLATISAPDQYLSTAFEFTEEIEFGYKQISISVRHYSNAGIKRPNLGRNFLLLNYHMFF